MKKLFKEDKGYRVGQQVQVCIACYFIGHIEMIGAKSVYVRYVDKGEFARKWIDKRYIQVLNNPRGAK